MRPNIQHVLSTGLASWLEYERQAGREGVFSEKYMALPISQLLAHNFSGVVSAETNHPVLSIQGNRGRPPQLDFTIQDDKEVKACVETKWIGNTDVTIGDVIWDCVRLELAAHEYNCEGIFVLAGKRNRLESVLLSDSFQSKSRKGNISPIMNLYGRGKYSINSHTIHRTYGLKLREYMNRYPDVNYPQSVVCGHGVQTQKNKKNNPYIAAVWIVRPERGKHRYTFKTNSA
jgi:hypothetical protein